MYPKTVRFRFIIVAAVWRSFGYEKNIMTLVCKWGGYFISKRKYQQPLLQQQVPVAVIKFFDGTNRNAEHPVTILVPNELML
jgi:hypothetical protein